MYNDPKLRPQAAKERHFANLFLKYGVGDSDVDHSKIEYCEKRAYLKPGEGIVVIRREDVQRRIKDKQDLIRRVREEQDLFRRAHAAIPHH